MAPGHDRQPLIVGIDGTIGDETPLALLTRGLRESTLITGFIECGHGLAVRSDPTPEQMEAPGVGVIVGRRTVRR
ncbi:hypothetical protein RU01_08175 [Rhodococcus sp. MEB064]|nr:hypothetical protein RU01_08175 [Rhodococcus sp. MEB064]